MIRELYIENFILIKKATIQFDKGLNIITGETGAGKSIVFNAINIVVGDLAKSDFIRENEKMAIIEATFDTTPIVDEILQAHGITLDDDFIIVTREIHNNKVNVARINGRRVNVKLISKIGDYLIDFHGQHAHQSLLKTSNHLAYLDNYSQEESQVIFNRLETLVDDYQQLKSQLKEYEQMNAGKDREVDLIQYELNEITAANLKDGEYEELKARYDYLKNLDKIQLVIEKSIDYISSDDNIYDQLSDLKYDFEEIKDFDAQLEGFYDDLKNVLYTVEQLNDVIHEYSYELDYNDQELTDIQNRMDLINNLMRKYGNSIELIKAHEQELKEQLETYETIEEKINTIQQKIETIKTDYFALADELTEIRKKYAKKFEKNLIKEFKELNLKDAQLTIDFKQSKAIDVKGQDQVEFLISTNLGQSFHPLKDIVSGGELSRIMLAIKLVVKEINDVSTLIFDEVDSGISGYTADIVGKKLKKISRDYQVLAITHLPQIAVYSDHHISIEKIKDVKQQSTKTVVNILEDDDRKIEIAKLISGDNITEKALNNAVELLQKANQ